MGAGKTTVGRLLASRLRRDFLDSDHEIEARCGVKVSIIFEIEGEDGFRNREAAVIKELTSRAGIVLATGGGAVLRPGTRLLLASRGVVVYLHAQPHDLCLRTSHDKNRPLLLAPDPLARLEQLYAQRDPLYREIADLIVETGRQSIQVLLKQVLSRLAQKWQLSA